MPEIRKNLKFEVVMIFFEYFLENVRHNSHIFQVSILGFEFEVLGLGFFDEVSVSKF